MKELIMVLGSNTTNTSGQNINFVNEACVACSNERCLIKKNLKSSVVANLLSNEKKSDVKKDNNL